MKSSSTLRHRRKSEKMTIWSLGFLLAFRGIAGGPQDVAAVTMATDKLECITQETDRLHVLAYQQKQQQLLLMNRRPTVSQMCHNDARRCVINLYRMTTGTSSSQGSDSSNQFTIQTID